MQFFDIGFNFYPGDPEYSFIPHGIHSTWLVNYLISLRRFNESQTSTIPGTNNDLFESLRHVDNQELLTEMIDEIFNQEDDVGDVNIEDGREFLSSSRPIIVGVCVVWWVRLGLG